MQTGYQAVIDKYYPLNDELRHILLTHSRSVADLALNYEIGRASCRERV